MLLGVNIDHVATLRQVRFTSYPDPVEAAVVAEQGGADGITLHLREDRRHIQEKDVWGIKEAIGIKMNFEMAATPWMLNFVEQLKPQACCLVPERREELTTEGGLDVRRQLPALKDACAQLAAAGIEASLFIDADPFQIEAAIQTGAPVIEIHTGVYAEEGEAILSQLKAGAKLALEGGLIVNAGHGLHLGNVLPLIQAIPQLHELNIGHSIIARAILVGLEEAIREMKLLLRV